MSGISSVHYNIVMYNSIMPYRVYRAARGGGRESYIGVVRKGPAGVKNLINRKNSGPGIGLLTSFVRMLNGGNGLRIKRAILQIKLDAKTDPTEVGRCR